MTSDLSGCIPSHTHSCRVVDESPITPTIDCSWMQLQLRSSLGSLGEEQITPKAPPILGSPGAAEAELIS